MHDFETKDLFDIEKLLSVLGDQRVHSANEAFVKNGDIIVRLVINDESLSVQFGDSVVYSNCLILRPFFSISGKNDGAQDLNNFKRFDEQSAMGFPDDSLETEYIYKVPVRELLTTLFEDFHQLENSKNQDSNNPW